MKKELGWQRQFEDPIITPDGKRLVTFRDAAEYIVALPAKEAKLEHWQTAMRELIICAEQGGIRMLAQIGMLRALHHGRPAPEKPPRKKAAKRYRVIR
jgi:hypothetical protein